MNRNAATREAGTAQGLTLILVAAMPIMAIAALVADLPVLLQVFRDVPNHEFLVPMIITVPSACVALFSSVAGVMADRWGRRRLLIVSLLAFSALGVMPLFFGSLHAIIASRVVVGLAEAAILVCCNALWGDYFGEDERKQWLARQQMSGPVFNALLALSGGALAAVHWRGPFLLYGLGLLVCALVAIYIWEPRREAQAPVATVAVDSHFPWAIAARIGAVTLGVSIVFFILAIQQGRVLPSSESPHRRPPAR